MFLSLSLLPLSLSLKKKKSLGPVAQLVRVLSRYTKVVGSIPNKGTYKNQPMNV